ncbi:hypothetical protein TraAM80_00301 [Trypanosoma rangeli]|uniref:Uncharacterized protein n=1 Tax=Trypanosoma rangeli TaxID=5698 RepID=A0A422P411_TRYRA|nr:uncharacterized protein TraAM80_00301 [Trypanosoma rangeli]RNF12449.1 hypothetical protein TraAM80_00301 [Trypanosoma rangeli]|eukprot:RNF12449.1 hypothetical protein TraAM80_00301 [Trypanosoma rangeli]
MTELVVFENHDVYLEHATRVKVPCEIDTIEHFLRIVSAHIAAFSGDATAAGRYRFVYSLKGKPLWHVADCLAAAEVVVSCTPGFLQRKRSTDLPVEQSGKPRCFAEVSAPTSPFDVLVSSRTAAFSSSVASSVNVVLTHEVSPNRNGISKRIAKVGAGVRSGRDIELDSTVFIVSGRRVVLPPLPRFVDPALGAAMELRHTERVAAVRVLLSLKLLGRPFPEGELLFCEELQSRLEPVVERATSRAEEVAACVVVEGPPKSGVSTTLAYCCQMVVSEPSGRLFGCLFLPLNFEILFDSAWLQDSREGNSGDKEPPVNTNHQHALLLDVSFFYLTLVRVVVDAAVAQRPSLRDYSQVLVEAWEQLVTRDDLDAPEFGDPQLTQVVGHRAVYEWEAFAAAAVQVLHALKASPQDMQLRDAFIEIVLVRFVSHVASALRFSGVVYIIDGLRLLAGVLQHRVRRTLGDAGVFLRCLTQHSWAHVFAGVDTLAFPPSTMLFSAPSQCVRLLHLLSPELLTKRYGYPVVIYCCGERFSLQIFMGAPGYLRILHTLLDAHTWTTTEQREGMSYALRVDDDDVLYSLQSLSKLIQLEAGLRLD